ncbi:uncharacterized protein LOC127131340 [Lathyrus oleraceus]|uniref:uncharacterized protein LOC127131340 n=1 Tax=Pisum sativum TaxID=3888 RepID=UPI0021D1140D|nr:uncharacterized protein LOC127131340 [Pisum sativum]
MPLKAVKGQVVADFIVDHSIDANALDYHELEPWKLYFDGSSHRDGTGIGVVIISPNKIPTRFKYRVEGLYSNNDAEYEALIAGLEILLGLGEDVIEFIQKHIIYRFGIPETVTTDQGSVFTGREMQEFATEMGFKLLTSTPYYAQANGQVEAANKVIIGLIKKHVKKKPRNWHKTLVHILWACHTSPKEATKSTPFRLTFGHDVVLPVETHLQSIRIQRHHELPTESYWSMMMDELVDLDEERLNALELLKRKKKRIEISYNKRVKVKSFSPEDLVWKVILPMDRKDRALGKWEGPFQILQVFSNGAYEIEELNEDRRILRVNGKYLKRYRPVL